MKRVVTNLLIFTMLFYGCGNENNVVENKTEESQIEEKTLIDSIPYDMSSWIGKSQAFLYKIKNEQDYSDILDAYNNTTLEELSASLNTEEKKFAFWTNTYNAFIQHILNNEPSLYDDRGNFFKKDQISIAGEKISFDKIEHGIIRSSTMKLSLGYLPKPFPGKYEKSLRTTDRDARIHFVLNCGAKDCPPVYIYNEHTLAEDFDKVAKTYLRDKTIIDNDNQAIKTTPLFKWFIGDFGGKSGVKELLINYNIIDESMKDYDIEYVDYDWSLDLGNFGS